ncbi:trypsin-like serine peptidase [Streptosporangium sp. NPDC004631]
MTSSLPLLAGAALVTGLTGTSLTGAAVTEHGQRVASAVVQSAQPGRPAAEGAVAASETADVVGHLAARGVAAQRRVLDYWTPRRMAAAAPIGLLGTVTGALSTTSVPVPVHLRHGRTGGAQWNTGGWVTRTTGRVFLTIDGVDFVCSASSVRSANRDLVVTAGHCVKNGGGAWADNWVFIPGYDRGRRPYGQFTARRMFVAGPWARDGDDSHDVGMVAVGRRDGRHLGDVAGAQDIAFGTPRGRQTHGFGFPADTPYDGEHLVYCAGPVRDDPHGQTGDQGLRCDMTAGASGGPWLSGFNPATGRGTVTSVSSFKYSDDRGTMYGPYFGETARQLYTVAQNS